MSRILPVAVSTMTICPQPTAQYGQTLATSFPLLIGTSPALAARALMSTPRPANSAKTVPDTTPAAPLRKVRRDGFTPVASGIIDSPFRDGTGHDASLS